MPDRIPPEEVARAAGRLLRGEERYRTVSNATGVPWQLIGLMHGLECGYDFNKHLHNGARHCEPASRVEADCRIDMRNIL